MGVEILIGDCRKVLATLPSDSVDCIVTSPPYWGLRNYHADGQIGLEPDFNAWLQTMVSIFRDLRRVLKPTGTCWLNCGDAYASTPNGRSAAATKEDGRDDRTFRDRPVSTVGVLKAKQRMMMPARLAIALQDDGWWIRDEIIWHKPNPMPSSVKDRTTPAHEMVYLLTKRARYYYDYVAVMEPCAVEDWNDGSRVYVGVNKNGANAKHGDRTTGRRAGWKSPDGWDRGLGSHGTILRSGREKGAEAAPAAETQPLRQRRSVWSIATQPMREAHFATFPEALVEPMILAGSGHRGCCADCGKPWERVVRKRASGRVRQRESGGLGTDIRREPQGLEPVGGEFREGVAYETASWRPTCTCPTRRRVPAVVLDPFGGSGTVGLVAQRHQRDAILIELNPQYAEIARVRIDAERDTLFTQLTVKESSDADKPKPPAGGAGSLDPVAGDGGAAAADGL